MLKTFYKQENPNGEFVPYLLNAEVVILLRYLTSLLLVTVVKPKVRKEVVGPAGGAISTHTEAAPLEGEMEN